MELLLQFQVYTDLDIGGFFVFLMNVRKGNEKRYGMF